MADHPVPDAALDTDIAILGKKGRGKSYTARGIVERLLDLNRRVLILDPLSHWWGLKSSADGKSAAYPVAVFGGPHGDMPVNEKIGRELARALAPVNLPAVIDMGEMTKAAQNRLVGDLLDELKAVNREALTIVLEEADMFAPQSPMGDDSIRVLGAVDWIARRGRARGFRLISITQRPAKLHKDVLTQLSVLVTLGLSSPQDRDAIKAWVEGNADRDKAREVTDSLAKLAVGEGWVWYPDGDLLKRVQFPQNKTLDTSRTPKAGEKPVAATTLAQVDLSAIKAALTAEAPIPASGKPAQPDATALKDAEARGYQRGFADGEKAGHRAGLAVGLARAQQALAALRVDDGDTLPTRPVAVAPRTAPPPVADLQRDPILTPTSRKILDAIHRAAPMGLTFDQAAARAAVSKRSSQYRLYRQQVLASDEVTIRDDGRIVSRLDKPVTEPGIDPIEAFAARLPPSVANMLRVIAAAPGSMDKIEIATRAGVSPTSSGLASGLKELRAQGLITVNGSAFALHPDLPRTGGQHE